MAAPRVKVDAPPWFDVARYHAADQMDAADWYLNLSLRGAIARGACKFGRQYVRGPKPIIRRAEESPFDLAFIHSELRGDFATILDGEEPPAGVEHLRAFELYFFERGLPEAIRQFGSRYVHGRTPESDAPAGFFDPVDSLFDQRYLGAFVRVNLSLPDKILCADFQEFLTRERRALAAKGGEQPFATALHVLGKCNRAKLKTFANLGVLPFLDVEQWRIDSGASIRPAPLARLLNIGDDDLRETRKKARLVLDDFILRGWLLNAARVALRKPRS